MADVSTVEWLRKQEEKKGDQGETSMCQIM